MKTGSKSIKKYTCYTVLAAVYFGILAYHWIYITIYPLDRLFTFLAMLIYSDISTQIGYHLSKHGHRSILGAFVCGVFPQVLYSIIIYGRYYKLMLTLCLLVTLIVCLFVIPSIWAKPAGRAFSKKAVKNRIATSLFCTRTCLTLCFIPFVASIVISGGVGLRASEATVKEGAYSITAEDLAFLDDSIWQKMTPQEKIDSLEKIHMFEQYIREVPNTATVKAGVLDWTLGGFYLNSDKSITINATYIFSDSPREAVRILLHEGRHCFQYYVAYNINNETAAQLRSEFESYKSPYAGKTLITSEDEYEEYYYQLCEIDARAFAYERTDWYYGAYSALKAGTIDEVNALNWDYLDFTS